MSGSAAWRSWLVVLAGIAHALALASPWDGQPLWWLQMLAMLVLLSQLPSPEETSAAPGQSWRRAAWLGWLFGLGWLAGTFWWLFIAMHTYGGLPAPLAVLAVLALAGLLALYYGAACAFWQRVGGTRPMVRATTFAACWTLAELARGTWLTGFPWGAVGYAHVDGPFSLLAPWIGVYGIGAVATLLTALPVMVARAPVVLTRQTLLTTLLMAVGLPWLAFQAMAMSSSIGNGHVTVSLLQGNIPQDEKFEPGLGVPVALAWYGQQISASTAALVVAPETALPVLPHQLPAGYWDALQSRFAQGQQALLVGIPLGDREQGYTNSVLGLHPGLAAPYRYDKHHLVPFGEFTPSLFKWFTAMMNIPLGDFNRGSLSQASFDWQGQRLAPHICYEDLFGEELAVRFVQPDTAPTAFVNFSNLGWFGEGAAIDQHLQIARMRALELERPFLRATNTGATVIIDHRGRITYSLPRATRAALNAEFEGRRGSTAYARWAGLWGLAPIWLFCGAVLLLAMGARRWRRPAMASQGSA